MNILMIYYYFGTPKGGWSTRAYEFTRRWVKEGHKVSVVTAVYDKSDLVVGKGIYEVEDYDGVKVYKINLLQSNKHSFLRRVITFILVSLVSCFLALKLKYDIVLASSGPITVGLPALVAKFLRNKRYIFEVRDLWPSGAVSLGVIKNSVLIKICFRLERIFYLYSSAIVTCSKGMSAHIIKRYPMFSNKIYEIPNSSDVDLFQKKSPFVLPERMKGKQIVCYTGSLGIMDNCIQLINGILAFKQLYPDRFDNLHFVFLGEGVDRPFLEDKVIEYNLAENVTFLGLVPKTTVICWLQSSNIGMLVFKDNEIMDTCSPNKFFDYLSAGLPVLQSTRGWLKDTVEQYEIGMNFIPNNAESFALSLFELIDNPVRSGEMGQNSLQLAKSIFSRDILASNYLKIISKANGS